MKRFAVLALAVAVGLATAASPFASGSPDGLERVAEDKAFAHRAETQRSPIRDYAFPGIEDERLATGLAGFAGTLLVFGAALGVAQLGAQRRHRVRRRLAEADVVGEHVHR